MKGWQTFSTDAFAPAERYAAWADGGWPSLAAVLETRPPDGAFGAEVATLGSAAGVVSCAAMTGLDYARGPDRIRADGFDHFALMLSIEGHQAIDFDGASGVCRPGDILIGDMTRTSRWRSSDSRAVTLTIPRQLALSIVPGMARAHGMVLPAARAALFRDHLLAVIPHLADTSPAAREGVMRASLHLLAGLFDEPRPEAAAGAGFALMRRRRVEALIAAHAADPLFSMDALAALAGLSRSALYRLFDGGPGPAELLRTARLEMLRARLADPADARSLEAISRACGFRDSAAAARVFQARMDMTPAIYRRICRAES